jgi:preprotein translocase subunit SecD
VFQSRDLNIRGNKRFKKRLHIVIICVLLLTLTGCNQIRGLFSFSNTFSITLDTTENISKTQLKQACDVMENRIKILKIDGTASVKNQSIIVTIKGIDRSDELIEKLCRRGNICFIDESGNTILDNSSNDLIESAQIYFKPLDGKSNFSLEVHLCKKAAEEFGNFTEQNIGKHIGIIIDQEMYSYPLISEKIENGIFEMDNIKDEENALIIKWFFPILVDITV